MCDDDIAVDERPFSKTIDHRYLPFSLAKRAIFLISIPVLGIFTTIILAFYNVLPTMVDFMAFLIMYLIAGLGMTVGYHRHFTHKAFKASKWVRRLFIITGSFCAQGTVISWVTMHRCHHKYSDQHDDPHSPYFKKSKKLTGVKKFWHSHIGWTFDYVVPNPIYYARDLLRDPDVIRFSQYYYYWVLLGILLPGVVCGLICQSFLAGFTAVLWGGLIRLVVGANSLMAIASLTHMVGKKEFKTSDESRNIWWLSIFTFGESWHNNHHAFPASAKLGFEWWQLDLGGFVICLLEKLGLIWDVKQPSIEQRNSARFQ